MERIWIWYPTLFKRLPRIHTHRHTQTRTPAESPSRRLSLCLNRNVARASSSSSSSSGFFGGRGGGGQKVVHSPVNPYWHRHYIVILGLVSVFIAFIEPRHVFFPFYQLLPHYLIQNQWDTLTYQPCFCFFPLIYVSLLPTRFLLFLCLIPTH